ncbi:hypothetical protein Pla123a_11170 [Posidoniimonas polymericola]|uniref:LamG-like jellyroll fold domain-containing protein n=1 Tax=Posidoniimonas polymericola TaxID=2528002 RepID=A0A5C5YU75_9BACT|nr:LamG-like jellyroll fold domain-containing protein [Posidoniimonas polymericola]TWT78326.1 hypothetical protein Pla123a_11170 [Posidoniimonas polymericola]
MFYKTSTALATCVGLLLTAASAPTSATQLQDGLITYWPLNEGSGTTAGDAAPGGGVTDNGELRNSPTWSSGKFGGGLQFNGVDQDVLIPNSTDMDVNTSGLTLSVWVKLDQVPDDIVTSFSGIYDSAPDNYVMYLDRGNNELRFKATTAGGGAERPGIPAKMLDTTEWHHVMGVFDGVEASNSIYFDGQLVDRHSAVSLLDVVRSGQIASIGGQPAVDAPFAPTSLFQGQVSDVAVWNRSLGVAEAQYLYNGGVGNAVGAANPDISPAAGVSPVQPTAQPVIYYNFNGNLDNHGTGGAALNATLQDAAGRNDSLYSSTTFGQGVDLSENPVATPVSETEPGDYLSVEYTLSDSGTIAMQASITELYNFQTLWANSSHPNDWEAWIYENGRFAARADRSSSQLNHDVFLFDDPLALHHYAYAWERDGDRMDAALYIDGVFQGQVNLPWRDPGTEFYIGGGPGNHLSKAVFDEVRIYNTALSEAELLYLSMNAPETTILTGDYNLDGVVDAADYTVWRDADGTSVVAGSGADGNGDGVVDSGDYLVWKTHYGESSGSAPGSAAIAPEPAALGLLLAASIGVLSRRGCSPRRALGGR